MSLPAQPLLIGRRLILDLQVILLLKSSDRIVHDLELLSQIHPAGSNSERRAATLCLRKWRDLLPEREFR